MLTFVLENEMLILSRTKLLLRLAYILFLLKIVIRTVLTSVEIHRCETYLCDVRR